MSVSGERGKSDDQQRRLEEVLDAMPKSWRPWVGAVLVGQVVRYDRAESPDGSCWLCVLEEPETGDLITIFLSASELESEKPTPGEMIGVKPDAEEGHKQFRLIVVGRVPLGEPPMGFSGEAPVSQGNLLF